MIVMRSRKDLNLSKSILEFKFEFGIVPTSLLASSGKLYAATDKSKIVKLMEKLSEDCSVKHLSLHYKTCNDFATAFVKRLLITTKIMTKLFVFDRYLPNSLKAATRNKRKIFPSFK
jgi:hypothetical protein